MSSTWHVGMQKVFRPIESPSAWGWVFTPGQPFSRQRDDLPCVQGLTNSTDSSVSLTCATDVGASSDAPDVSLVYHTGGNTVNLRFTEISKNLCGLHSVGFIEDVLWNGAPFSWSSISNLQRSIGFLSGRCREGNENERSETPRTYQRCIFVMHWWQVNNEWRVRC